MSQVLAVTPIRWGSVDDGPKTFKVGDEIVGPSDEQIQVLIDDGAAIEFGEEKRFTPNPTFSGAGGSTAPIDEDTLKRDQLIKMATAEASGANIAPQPAAEQEPPGETPPPADLGGITESPQPTEPSPEEQTIEPQGNGITESPQP